MVVRLRFVSSVSSLLCLVLPAADASAGYYEFDVLSKTPSAVTVRVSAVIQGQPCTGYYCRENQTIFRVSPCPPGQSCVGGTYEYATGGYQLDIALDPGVNYTFSGDFSRRTSSQSAPCVYTCEYHEGLGPSQYQAPSLPSWDVTVVSANLDTTVIELSLVGSHPEESWCYYFTAPSCSFEQMRWVISPCPLLFKGQTSYVDYACSGGTFDFAPPFASNIPVQVALQTGVVYTFSGYVTYVGVSPERDLGCNPYTTCSFVEEPLPVTYLATPIRTRPATWGTVKALYRSP